MSWRQIVIDNKYKAEYNNNYMVIKGEIERRIHLSEIDSVIFSSTASSITANLIVELAKRKIKLIFCDEKHNPCCESLSLFGNVRCSKMLQEQISWNAENKETVWTMIVREKILNQSKLLGLFGETQAANQLLDYIDQLTIGDSTNREGHAAKVYFNALFGKEYSRQDSSFISGALDYGYAIILSAFNREIISMGYTTQIGIKHCNEYNPYNLSCDLMEPYRQYVDCYVRGYVTDKFDKTNRFELVNLLNYKVIIDNQSNYIANAIKLTAHSQINAINNGHVQDILFPELVGIDRNELQIYENNSDV